MFLNEYPWAGRISVISFPAAAVTKARRREGQTKWDNRQAAAGHYGGA